MASANDVFCSYPLSEGDAEQSPTGLLRDLVEAASETPADPGWYACRVAESGGTTDVPDDPVPSVTRSESVTGGTATVQRQLSEPFSAFAYGRLGIRPLPRMMYGIPASQRGRLIHAALADLYGDVTSRDDLQRIDTQDLEARRQKAARKASAWLESRADTVLRQLLQLEKQRIVDLLGAVIELDLARAPFEIVGLEIPVSLVYDEIEMALRVDRIDRDGDGGLLILDYKTGRRRRFLNADKKPDDMQLVAYARAIEEAISGLAFVNVDSRHVDMSGAGRDMTPDLDWDVLLEEWRAEVDRALCNLQKGDVRLNGVIPAKDSREFGLLSRIRELRHE